MESNITTFRGRRCTRVKRQGGTAPTAAANSSNSTSKTSSSTSSTSAKPDATSSTALAGAQSPPVPIPPPPPPESETAQGVTSVMRSMLPDTPASNTPKNPGPATAPAPTTSAPKPNAPSPAPTSAEEETVGPSGGPSVSIKPIIVESPPGNAPPTPIAPPPTSVAPTPVPVPVASNKPKASAVPPSDPKPKESPKPGGQAPAAGGQSPSPAGSDPGAAPQPQPAAASSQRGGGNNPQNTLPAVSGAAPGATNPPNSSPAQPNAGGQPDGSGSGSGQGSGSDSGNGIGSGSGSGPAQIQPFPQAGNSPMINPTGTGVVPFPVMVTSNPPRPIPTIIVTTGKGGSLTSFTTTLPVPKTMVGTSMAGGKTPGGSAATHDPNVPHADGGTHVPGDTHPGQAKKVDVGAIGGSIAAVFGVALIAFLIIFCGKRAKRRKRGSDTPLLRNAGAKPSIKEKVTALMSTARLSGANTAATPVAGERRSIKERVTSLFGVQFWFGGDKTAAPVARSTTPALERGMREVSTSNVARSRASSAPAQSFRERALGPLALFGRRSPSQDLVQAQPKTEEPPPRIPTPVAQHRRSASSVSSIIQAWTATGEDNNPFRDPDPARPLRLLNPDLSRSNTANTLNTLRQPVATATIPSPLKQNTSYILATTTTTTTAAAERSPPPFGPIPSRPQHKRSFSQSRIPNPFLDPEPQPDDGSASRSQTPDEYMSSRHSRTKSVASTRQSQYERRLGSLMHQASTSTIDSGFVSATVSPQVRQGGFARNDKMPSYRVDSDTTPYGLSTVPGSRSHSASSLRTSSITPSQMLDNPDHGESPFSDSYRASKISFDFGPESLGSEAGATRPTTSNFPSYILDEGDRRMSRASDPFDLDRPEILGLMKLGLYGSRDTSLSRSGSGKSVGSERSGMKGKRKSQGTNWFLNSESVREI